MFAGMRIRNPLVATAGAVVIASVFGACGGGSSPTSPSGGGGGTSNPPSSGSGNVITITTSGVSPKQLMVSPGTRVQFVNNDTSFPNHDIQSDPHPEHTDCPQIGQVGFIVPGQTKETSNLNTVRMCGYHDHNLPDLTRYQGQIIIR